MKVLAGLIEGRGRPRRQEEQSVSAARSAGTFSAFPYNDVVLRKGVSQRPHASVHVSELVFLYEAWTTTNQMPFPSADVQKCRQYPALMRVKGKQNSGSAGDSLMHNIVLESGSLSQSF